MKGEAFKGRLFTAMAALWEEQLRHGPLVLVCDDLHWTDPASAELLQHLLPLVERGPLLILLSMRPDTETPGWKVKEAAETALNHRFTGLQLRPLSAEEGGRLVDSLLAISDLPPRLRALIQEKTEGNPFFVEEVVRTFIDDGLVVRGKSGARWRASGDGSEIHVPDNVQAVLAARIDRLEADARKTLQLASVVGRSFYYRVLARVVDLIGDLNTQLLTLQQTQFIEEGYIWTCDFQRVTMCWELQIEEIRQNRASAPFVGLIAKGDVRLGFRVLLVENFSIPEVSVL